MVPANEPVDSIRRSSPGFGRRIKHTLRVDMTPMVDLGFLLISFFVISTRLSEPKAMDLYMPVDGPPMPLGMSNALTVILDKDNTIYYYHGDWKSAVETGSIFQTNYSAKSGLRALIVEKQKSLDLRQNSEGRDGLMLLIKPLAGSSYKNVVDVLDETAICIVKKYAFVPLLATEKAWLEKRIPGRKGN